MDALKLKQQQSPLTAQQSAHRSERGWDVPEYDGIDGEYYTDEEVWDRLDKRMIAHYGESMRRSINKRRAEFGEKLL
ncbi:MAG: hypothetical protein LBT78_09050 [Tannerella sp.]|jgi:hypothetical protein|nr:hypothetical protein [Tannerella sp.]